MRLFFGAMIAIVVLALVAATAEAGHVVRPTTGDSFTISATYTFEAQLTGAEHRLKWTCDPAMGYFPGGVSVWTVPGPVLFTPIATGYHSITVQFYYYNIDMFELCTPIQVTINQYAMTLVSDDNYSLSTRTPGPEPEMDGTNEFIAPKGIPINLRFRLTGPPGNVVLQFNHVSGSPGTVTYPTTETVAHNGVATTEYIVSSYNSYLGTRIEGTVLSLGKSDIDFRLRICDSGFPEYGDPTAAIAAIAKLTVAEIEKVDPTQDCISDDLGEPCARVMINSQSSDSPRFHNGTYEYQNASTVGGDPNDVVITVRSTMKPPIAGVTLWAKTVDTDDPSLYEPDNEEGDNLCPSYPTGKLWTLAEQSQWGVVWGTEERNANNNIIQCAFRKSDANGAIKFLMATCITKSGETYEVRMGFTAALDEQVPEAQRTCTLTTWKRYYVEVDKMRKADAVTQVSLSASSGATFVCVESLAGFANNDTVEFVNSDNQREVRTVTLGSLYGNVGLSFSTPLEHAYPNAFSFAVKPSATEVWEANRTLVDEMLADACVECKYPGDGCETVPHFPVIQSSADPVKPYRVIKNDWFSHKADDYYLYVLGADRNWGDVSGTDYAQSFSNWRTACVFAGTVSASSAWQVGERPQANKEVTAHECGHNSGEQEHCPEDEHGSNPHPNGKPCVMKEYSESTTGTMVDGSVYMHEDHLWSIRDRGKP